ncbi:MAG: hypothetical protein ACR2HV_02215, partial [Acidimicrobiales bacterium]
LTVTRTDDAVQVTLEGAGPTDPRPNRVDVLLERCKLPPGIDAGAVELTRLEQSGDETPAWARAADSPVAAPRELTERAVFIDVVNLPDAPVVPG